MNAILLGRAGVRRLLVNGHLRNGFRQQRNNSNQPTNGKPVGQHQANQQKPATNQPPTGQAKQQQTSTNRNLAIAGIAVGGILSTYLLVNSFRKPQQTAGTTVQDDRPKEAPAPKLIDDLPDEIEYLIVGGGSAAFSALRTIRARETKSKVIVVNAEDSYPYMRPPLSKELWFADHELAKDLKFKQWNEKERSLFYAHEEFYFNLRQLRESENGGVSVIRGHRVVKIDPYDQYVILDNGQTLKYGKCLLATGSKGIQSELERNASDAVRQRILKFGSAKDFKHLHKLVQQNKSVVLVGSEFLASELACALSKQEKGDVVQVMESKGVLQTVLPEYLGEWTSKCLQAEGVKQITSAKVKSAEFVKDKVVLHLSNGQTLQTDYLIIDNGAEPNIDLATSGLEVCPVNGGLLVNAELQARTNLWVAGDVASFYDEKLGRRRVPHHDNSLITGRLAGENMSGGHKIYWHQPIMWSDLGPKVGFEAIGIVDASLPTVSVFTKPEKQAPSATQDDVEKELAIKLPNKSDDYYKGVVFYIREGIVVGVLLWNVFSKTALARRVINDGRSYEDLSELAKLFELHREEFGEEQSSS